MKRTLSMNARAAAAARLSRRFLAFFFSAALALSLSLGVAHAQEDPVPVSLPDSSGFDVGETIQVPVYVDAALPDNVFSADVTISYDPEVVSFTGEFTAEGTISEQFDLLTVNVTEPGTVKIAAAGGTAVSGGPGTFVLLEVQTQGNGTSPLEFTEFMFNEGTPEVTTTDGSLTVGSENPPPQVDDPIEDQTLNVGGGAFSIDLTTVFSDPDGDMLTFSATSSDSDVATAEVAGDTLAVTPVAEGTATVTVEATDEDGGTAQDAFEVTVNPAQSNATVTFNDQTSEDGQTVTVASVTIPEDGYVAIHDSTLLGPDGVPFTDDDQPLESVIGVSEHLEAGSYEDFDVTLFEVLGKDFPADTTLPVDQTLIAMPHQETNGNQEYNFITSGGSEDIPYFNNEGNPVVDPGFVDVPGDEGSNATVTFNDQTSEDGQTVTVASVTLPDDGYVAIHDSTLLGPDGVPFTDDDQPLESVIGVSEYREPGTYEDFDVTLFDVPGKDFPADTTLPVDQTLIAMPHQETNGNQQYNFITSGGSEDIPYFNNEGNPVVDPGFVDVIIGPLVINEVHADPASGEDGDANGDGTRDAGDDEFVEIANVGDSPIDISGYTLSDEVGVRHTFPEGTVLEPGVGAVVFGGGDPASFPGVTQTASSGSLSLNNTGDMVIFESDDGTEVTSVGYGTEGPAPSPEGESLARNPDFSGAFVPHTDIGTDRDGDGMADLYSPGYQNVDSTPLPVEVVGFSAQVEGRDVNLRWKTPTETNNAGFYVQYQRKAQSSWTTANPRQIIEGKGTTLEETPYTFRVSDLQPGAYTFRLQQKDYGSRRHVLNGVEAKATVETADRYELSPAAPNPFQSRATFRLNVQKEQKVTVELYNTLGQRVERLYSGSVRPGSGRVFTIEGDQLASGVYFYRVRGENFSTARRIVLVK